MTTTVELAVVPTADTPGSCIYVHHDKRSYILGRLADGTQRAFGSRKIHLGGTEHIFLSGPVSPDEMGGLFGYLLSVGGGIDSAKEHVVTENQKRRVEGNKLLKQVQHNGVAIHGGENLCHLLASCRPVVLRQSVQVRPCEHRTDPRAAANDMNPDWEDDAVRVWKIPLRTPVTTPPKRRHGSPDEPESAFKPPATLSDPTVASLIVQNVMFTGTNKNPTILPCKRLSELKPGDVAVVKDRGTLAEYKGPYASDGVELPEPGRRAWVFGRSSDSSPQPGSPGDSGLAINHFPLSPTRYGQTSMSYILKCHDRRGKFNAPVANQLGVKREYFKRLTNGESVQGKDGTVTPDMVLGERQPGNGIIVADIPSRDFVDAFMERPEWQSAELMANIIMMYWILAPGLAQDPRVQSFIHKHPQVKHVLCAPETCPNMITHTGPAELQVELRRIDPQRFPLLDYDNTVKHPAPAPDSPVELGRAGRKLMLMPRVVHKQEAMAAFPDLAGAAKNVSGRVLALAEQARVKASDPGFLARVEETERDIPNRDAEVIPLGTGSSMPSKYRNVSGTLIRVPGIGNYLLDCGEGTLGQMQRAFGADDTAEVLRGLRCVVISHVHADHHSGAVALLKAWYEQALRDERPATLAVSCIDRYRTMLQELAQVSDFGFHRLRFPSCPPARDGDGELTTARDLAAMAEAGGDTWGLASVTRVAVPHCWRSYATQLELTSGLRIAYSGDCRPSPAFARACRGAHLLVHECTFDDDRQDHARAKKHSTMGEALGVARDMQARRTLLTHFSQRYSKADSLVNTPADDDAGVLLALDLMRVRLGDFQIAACYVPAVQALLEELAE